MIEPIAGEGGFIVPAEGFLPGLAAYAAEHGIVFVADEVQTGFARTGAMFACEHEGVVPDLITTAKGIAGGLPLAAVTGRAEIMDAAHAGASAAPTAATRSPAPPRSGRSRPSRSRTSSAPRSASARSCCPRCARWPSRYPFIGEVRGRGAMIAVELVEPGTLDPAADVTSAVAKACHAEGVLVLTAGTYGNVLRFLPPLVMPEHLLVDALGSARQGVRDRRA